ncbi:DUF2510 domain-containing protein [Nocardioides stalactiti]|uniref:DUF2510 domain-containing protein n=1 Tax=Nocardioides stalactiti TaxID=2755356 RepID=UPI00160298A8|nr:DUF2510 domain-containing protein [Nocardioides stalactiti]
MSTTPPGWYLDPHQLGMYRYWDGERWTSDAVHAGRANFGSFSFGSEAALTSWIVRHKRLLILWVASGPIISALSIGGLVAMFYFDWGGQS